MITISAVINSLGQPPIIINDRDQAEIICAALNIAGIRYTLTLVLTEN